MFRPTSPSGYAYRPVATQRNESTPFDKDSTIKPHRIGQHNRCDRTEPRHGKPRREDRGGQCMGGSARLSPASRAPAQSVTRHNRDPQHRHSFIREPSGCNPLLTSCPMLRYAGASIARFVRTGTPGNRGGTLASAHVAVNPPIKRSNFRFQTFPPIVSKPETYEIKLARTQA